MFKSCTICLLQGQKQITEVKSHLTSSYLRLEQARDSWRKYFISTIWKLRWFQTSMCLRRILKKFPFMCHFFMILFLFWSGVLESSSSSEESSVARDSTLGGAFCYSPCGCVLCSRDYDVFEKEYMFKSCIICLLQGQKQITEVKFHLIIINVA